MQLPVQGLREKCTSALREAPVLAGELPLPLELTAQKRGAGYEGDCADPGNDPRVPWQPDAVRVLPVFLRRPGALPVL